MTRVLVIEDEPDLQEILAFNLRREGHEVLHALAGSAGLVLARNEKPDLIILDLMLPDLHGADVCRVLKADPVTQKIPILMLTARGEEQDRVLGFELGVEDYVVKPFSVRELMLRIRVILRRDRGGSAQEEGRMVVFGCLQVDRAAHRVWVKGVELQLTTIEYRLLTTLFDRRNRVQSRATLQEDVWGLPGETATRTVDTHVKRLREKLRAAGPYIETVRGVGYRFAEQPD